MHRAWITLAILLAGCSHPVGERPESWQAGQELLGHSSARYHSGGFEVRAFPQAEAAKPESCKAYRADREYGDDSCSIITSNSEHWFPIGNPAWGVMAEWKGRGGDTADDPDPDLPRTVVAFDAQGVPVAFWAGTYHAEARHATE